MKDKETKNMSSSKVSNKEQKSLTKSKTLHELLDDNYQYESEVNKENKKEKNNEILSKTPIN